MTDQGVLTAGPGGRLVVERHSGDTAFDALSRLEANHVAIGWSPRWAGFVVGQPSAELFELRAFDGVSEARWYRDPHGVAQTVLLREAADGERTDDGADDVAFEHRILGSRMLVWGTGTSGTAVRSRQVGELVTPLEVPISHQLSIEVIEYVGRDRVSGTALVVEERLVGLTSSRVRNARREA